MRHGADVVAYDMTILPEWRVAGRPNRDRAYLLLEEGVQLAQPVSWVGALEGGWYIDLVAIEETGPDRLVVRDLYVDLIILPTTRRYEVLDLDELADAVTTGVVDLTTATTVLRNTQSFIDTHLGNFDVEAPTTWPDFPPATIEGLATLPPFSTS